MFIFQVVKQSAVTAKAPTKEINGTSSKKHWDK